MRVTNNMDSIYRGRLSRGCRWEAKGRFFHTFEPSSYCAFIEVHKQPQFTCPVDHVIESSLALSVALLVHPTGTAHSIVDCHEFTGAQK